MVSVGSVLQVQQEVRTETIDPSRRNLVVVDRLILEYDAGDVDGVRVQHGIGRNGVIAGLKTRDGKDDQIEGHVLSRGVIDNYRFPYFSRELLSTP